MYYIFGHNFVCPKLQQWCQKIPVETNDYLLTHGPMPIHERVNGLFKSSAQFQQTWGCNAAADSFMSSTAQCSSFL